jgi:hypothetical protein
MYALVLNLIFKHILPLSIGDWSLLEILVDVKPGALLYYRPTP